MAVTLTADLTDIVNCDSITNWLSNESLEADTAIKRQGAASIGIVKVSQETSYAKFDYYTENSAYLDLSGDTHIYFWYKSAIAIDTKANGGIVLYLEDSGGNWAKWYVGGSDNYYGGFQCFVCYTGATPDSSSGTLNKAQIRYIGCYTTVTGKTVVGEPNVWVDIFRYGIGLIVKGGTAADKGTFDEIIAADETPAYGVMIKRYGAFILQGPITFGDNSGTTSTCFKDESQVLLFSDEKVSSAHYELKVVGNSTGTNSFELGSKVGTSGVSGCVIKSTGVAKFKFTATDTNVNEMKVYGCTFLDASTVSLPANATNKEVLSSNFEKSAEVLADTCVVKYCKFISPDDKGIRMSSTTHNITNCDFINCPKAVHIPNTGTYTFDALTFSGNTTDIDNTSGGSVTVNCTNGSNPGTYTGDTTIVNTVYLTVNVEDQAGDPIVSAQVYIEKAADKTQLMNEPTNAGGQAQENYNYTADTDINIRVRKSSPSATRYFPLATIGTITSTGFTLTAVLIKDEIVV